MKELLFVLLLLVALFTAACGDKAELPDDPAQPPEVPEDGAEADGAEDDWGDLPPPPPPPPIGEVAE